MRVTQHPKNLKKICRWLRERISPYDIGYKTDDGPRHCNTNQSVLSLFARLRLGLPRGGLDRLKNRDFLDHFEGRKTYYFTADGRSGCLEVLVNLDIDCHRSGSLAGAIAFAEHLRATHFPGLYFEVSTHGNGVHGYFVLRKGDLGDEGLNALLKRLDRWLKGLLAAGDWDVEGVEVKGLAPEFHWGEGKYELRAYQSGQLAKLPREALERGEELMGTTRLTLSELRRLVQAAPPIAPSSARGPRVVRAAVRPIIARDRSASSISGLSIPAELAEQIRGRLLDIARALFPAGMKTGMGRAVLPEDMAVLFAILLFCAANPNPDGSMPTARIRSLWEALHAQGYTERGWDHHKFKALRDWLSQSQLLTWVDENYVVGQVVNGVFQKGRAARWSASERLLGMLRQEEPQVETVGEAEDRVPEAETPKRERRETSLWAAVHPATLPFELPGWQFTWRAPRFAGYVGESGRMAA